jgi:ApbE superfamily uncharacterized protein (UPF0280 family)
MAALAIRAALNAQAPIARARARLLPSVAGALPRLHLQDGPIDLIIIARGEPEMVEAAYRAARIRFLTILDELTRELPLLRAEAGPSVPAADGAIAQRMQQVVRPLTPWGFITPMAAVAGAVAEAVLAAMPRAAPRLRLAAVNNGGDIALHLAEGERFTIGMVARPDPNKLYPGGADLFGRFEITARDAARGIATSGWRGRSFSLGIADAVTVLARTAAAADAAATLIANAVDLPGHAGILRAPASALQPDSDLGERLVTRGVPALQPREVAQALARGHARAEALRKRDLILQAALHLQGQTVISGEATDG